MRPGVYGKYDTGSAKAGGAPKVCRYSPDTASLHSLLPNSRRMCRILRLTLPRGNQAATGRILAITGSFLSCTAEVHRWGYIGGPQEESP